MRISFSARNAAGNQTSQFWLYMTQFRWTENTWKIDYITDDGQ
jgi:hypothetical protein